MKKIKQQCNEYYQEIQTLDLGKFDELVKENNFVLGVETDSPNQKQKLDELIKILFKKLLSSSLDPQTFREYWNQYSFYIEFYNQEQSRTIVLSKKFNEVLAIKFLKLLDDLIITPSGNYNYQNSELLSFHQYNRIKKSMPPIEDSSYNREDLTEIVREIQKYINNLIENNTMTAFTNERNKNQENAITAELADARIQNYYLLVDHFDKYLKAKPIDKQIIYLSKINTRVESELVDILYFWNGKKTAPVNKSDINAFIKSKLSELDKIKSIDNNQNNEVVPIKTNQNNEIKAIEYENYYKNPEGKYDLIDSIKSGRGIYAQMARVVNKITDLNTSKDNVNILQSPCFELGDEFIAKVKGSCRDGVVKAFKTEKDTIIYQETQSILESFNTSSVVSRTADKQQLIK